MSTSGVTQAVPPVAPTKLQGSDATEGTKRGSWFVRITVLVIVLLWLIPTLGVLIDLVPGCGSREHHGMVDGAGSPVP